MYEESDVRRRYRVWVISILTMALVTSPIVQNVREDPDDGFPFSYYPMFTSKRGETTNLTHPIGIERDGKEISLHYRVAGSGGMNQVRRQMRRIVRAGDAESLCREIAGRLSRSQNDRYGDIVEVRIVTDTYDLQGFFTGEQAPVRRDEHAACDVSRSRSSAKSR